MTLGDYILHLAACDPQPTMSDLANLPGVSRRGRIVGWSSLACWTVALGLTSFALSAITVTARWQLWLGPQTVILGSVGLCVGAMIALLARQFARACGADLLDRPLLSRRGVCALIIACATVASVILYIAFGEFPNSADEYGFLFQAKTFAHFRLWNFPPPDPGLFDQNYIIARGGIWISQYLRAGRQSSLYSSLQICHRGLGHRYAAPCCCSCCGQA